MRPTGNDSPWKPRWSRREAGAGGLWLVNRPASAQLYVDFPVDTFRTVAPLVSAWLEGWRYARTNIPDMDWTVGVLWLVLGQKFFSGSVRSAGQGKPVLEIAYGSGPAAPEDASEIPLRDTIRIL